MQGGQATKWYLGSQAMATHSVPSVNWHTLVVLGSSLGWRTRNFCGYCWLLFMEKGTAGPGLLLFFTS